MKKIIIFLISLFLTLLLPLNNVQAKTQGFYQAEYISNIFIHKITPSGKGYYSQARFIRKTDSHEIAYCIDPTVYFNDGYIYDGNETPQNLSSWQILDVTLLSHFGYGYPGHTDAKWYPITQTLIWEVVNSSMKYHMTTNKNPNTAHIFNDELNELRAMVNNYKQSTSLNNQTYSIVEGESLTLTDTNNVLSSYTSKDNIEIKGNTIKINNPQLGTHTFTLEKEHKLYNRHPLFYTCNKSQSVMDVGDPTKTLEQFTLKVINTEVELIKIDAETNENIPQGDASLTGAIFGLYNADNTLIKEIPLNNSTIKLKNLPFKTYYLQEIKPGEGYELNTNKYFFTISENNPTIKITIPNKVIKTKIIIKKEYGTEDNFKPEENISFNIYSQDKLIKTITTNIDGIAELELPYGKYKIVQLTTTDGYTKIEPIEFEVKDNKVITYNLKNYKIDVPNTKNTSLLEKIIKFIQSILCGKR